MTDVERNEMLIELIMSHFPMDKVDSWKEKLSVSNNLVRQYPNTVDLAGILYSGLAFDNWPWSKFYQMFVRKEA